MKFGEMLKDRRIEQKLTLRQCAAELSVDPSNWSKMERSITPAPKDEATLNRWADFLKIEGEDRSHFTDLASLSRNEIPGDVANDETVLAALPLFFRAVRGHELKGDHLERFIEDLRKVHSSVTSSKIA